MNAPNTAVILVNQGAPTSLDPGAIKQFLRQYFSDTRLVDIPVAIWWLLLRLFILPWRSGEVLRAYKRIWTDQGSPLLAISQRQQQALQEKLSDLAVVAVMMRYGEPSFSQVINQLLNDGVNRWIILPLYPQHSAISTASCFDHLADMLRDCRDLPSISFINNYHGDPGYIHALANSIQDHWKLQKRQRFLLMSFHGLAQHHVDRGDPYYDQCMGTAHLLATILGLGHDQWAMSFQSGFGPRNDLQPDTSALLAAMADKGLKEVDVICPGFATDCLETLEHIQIQNRDIFIQHGGEQYLYIPCLNDRDDHIEMMADLVKPYLA